MKETSSLHLLGAMTQTETARQLYDRLSGVYDVLADPGEQEARSLGLRLLAPTGSERLLVIGCGTGHGLVAIAERLGDGGRVTGLDVSTGMLAVARRRVEASACAPRIQGLVLADAQVLPLADRSFDAVFMSFTLELFADDQIPVVLAETARVMRRSGRLAVVAMQDDRHGTAIVEAYGFLHRHFPKIVDCRPIDTARWLRGAGFEIVASENASIWGLPVRAVAARLAAGGIE
jgi:demethylmenaquinone methyltransferase/2-methoxy-6-polyprenyl-1,4-benzoquinol methylase